MEPERTPFVFPFAEMERRFVEAFAEEEAEMEAMPFRFRAGEGVVEVEMAEPEF